MLSWDCLDNHFPYSFVITCWERADLLAFLFVVLSCVFVTFPYGDLCQVCYLIVSIPDLYLPLYFVTPRKAKIIQHKVSFKKSLEPSHGVLQLLKKNFYSVLILHLLKPLFSVFHELQALSIFFFFLVNDLYIGDPVEANKRQEMCINIYVH